MSRRDALLAAGLCAWAVGALAGEALGFAGAGACLLALLAPAPGEFLRAHRRGLWVFSAWLVWCGASLAWAARPLRSGAPWSALHVGLLPLAWLSWCTARATARRTVLRVLIGVGVASALVALTQHFVALHYSEWLSAVAPTFRVGEPMAGGGFKAGGLHFHRLKYAHTLVLLGLASWPYFWPRTAWRRAAFAALAALFVASLWATDATAAQLALGIGLAAHALGARVGEPLRRRVAGAAIITSLALPIALATFTDTPRDRTRAWRTALALAREHPAHGVGYGGYQAAALAEMGGVDAELKYIHFDAHSLWLQVLAEGGVVGLALVVAMLAAYASLWRSVSPARLAVLSAASTLAVVHNFAYHPVVVMAGALALALAPPADDDASAPAAQS